MNKKRIVSTVMAAVVALGAAAIASSCALIDAGTMEELVGTYHMTRYERSYPGEEEKVDFITGSGMDAYIVVTGESKGYLVYKDDDTPLVCNEIEITYVNEEIRVDDGDGQSHTETTDRIARIVYTTPDPEERYVMHHATLGFYNRSHLLNYTSKKIVWEHNRFETKYTDIVEFRLVSKDTDLTCVNSVLNTALTVTPYALAAYNGTLALSEAQTGSESGFEYYYLNINAATAKAEVCYALTSDSAMHRESNLAVSYTLGTDGKSAATVTVGETQFNALPENRELRLTVSVDGSDKTLTFSHIGGTIDGALANRNTPEEE